MVSVQWRNIYYNIGNHFDGTRFTAPKAGLYSFYAIARRWDKNSSTVIYLYVNGSRRISSGSRTADNDWFSLTIQTTLRLNRGDKVEVRLFGNFNNTTSEKFTFFEGRYIPRID